MTTVLAPLVDDVELVDAVELEVETVLSTLETPRTVPTLDTLLPRAVPELLVDEDVELEVEEEVELEVEDEVELEVEDEVERLLDTSDTAWNSRGCGAAVFTCAVATPCQTMPTSIIPAATATMRLTVVRRPGLIPTSLPSN